MASIIGSRITRSQSREANEPSKGLKARGKLGHKRKPLLTILVMIISKTLAALIGFVDRTVGTEKYKQPFWELYPESPAVIRLRPVQPFTLLCPHLTSTFRSP
jgi:hypothetical protein